MSRLEGRVAIVTGAASGIGASLARALAAEGASVVVADLGVALDGSGRDLSRAQEIVDGIVAAGGTASLHDLDVSDHGSAEELVRSTVESYGGLDILVNAAGILRDRMVFNLSEDDWDSVIGVHLKGCFNTTKFASIHWREQRKGNYRLINFTSIAGLHGNPTQPNYAAAKMGIIGFTKSCANGLAKYGVTANCVSPGAATRMTESIPAEKMAEFLEKTGRTAGDAARRAPESMVPAIVYLASEDSGWLSGRVVGAQEYRISLWTEPEIQRQIISPGPWSMDDVFTLMPAAFKPVVTGEPRLDEAG